MAVLSLTADCVAPLESYLTDQEPTPEEVEALLTFDVHELTLEIPDQLSSGRRPPNLVDHLGQIPQYTEAHRNELKQFQDLSAQKELILLELSLTKALLQLATQAASEAQSPSMKCYCQTMQATLQSKIDSLTERSITCHEQIKCCRRILIKMIDEYAQAVQPRFDPDCCDPQPCSPRYEQPLTREEIDALIDYLNVDHVASVLGISSPSFQTKISDQIKEVPQLTPIQLAQLRQYKDSLLLLALLGAELSYTNLLSEKVIIVSGLAHTARLEGVCWRKQLACTGQATLLKRGLKRHSHQHQIYEGRFAQIVTAE